MAKQPGNPSIGRASAFLASGTIASRLLGFLKAILLTQAIGVTSFGGNAFAVANQLPNTLYTIIAGGVISAILVPQIVRALVQADRGQAYINKLLTIAFVVLGAATAVAMLLAPWLTTLYGANMPPIQQGLAITMAYWCIPQLLFYGLYTVIGEILNAHKLFGPFTWAPVVNNVIAIIGLGVFVAIFGADAAGTWQLHEWTTPMIAVLAGSATLGVVAQALVLLLFWRRVGLRFRFDFHWRGVGFRETGKLAGWSFLMILVTTLGGLIQSVVASSVPSTYPGVFALQNAWLVFMLPHSVITLSVATAYFTRMAEHVRENRTEDLKLDVSTAIRQIVLLVMVATAFFLVVAPPFARVFTDDSYASVLNMASLIMLYLLGLVPFCVLFIFQRTFYALGDTRTPFFFTLAQTIIFVLLAVACLVLPEEFRGAGIALSMSVSILIQTLIAGLLLRRRLHGLDLNRIVQTLVIFTIAVLPAVLVGGGAVAVLGGYFPNGFGLSSIPSAVITMGVAGIVMVPTYILGLKLMRVPELGSAISMVKRRLGR
ncbi:MAG: murein biosynthesis integral membrane protein MurJ [Mycetocola sp.]